MSQVKGRRSGVARGKERVGLVLSTKLIQKVRLLAIKRGEIGSHLYETLINRGLDSLTQDERSTRN